ncbi:hypothetical protein SAMN04488058_11293 [Deinococcus reticulitermitis]|uniref:Tetratricopeptide repeat-containing protein n=1 Tax=Deinococcus reticulitermitis TaxID=856736 RepID=A0A1H7ANG1_9DEIO|nr:hypothetical protein [Deinococcus reticulitermitis]SEJ63612.1 hypothetical protein SAMN04488058_11293 [Deinococcus reticulitermitis]
MSSPQSSPPDSADARLILLPDLGDLLRLHPQYNAGTVAEWLRHLGAREVLWATGLDPEHPLRDALPAAGFEVREAAQADWSWAEAEHEGLLGVLKLYPQGRDRMREAGQVEAEFGAQLTQPLTPALVVGQELLAAAQTYHARTRELLDEGPGTHWRERRLGELASALAQESGVAVVPLDDVPELLARLPQAALPDPAGFSAGEMSRLRALADRAWQLREDDDLSALLGALGREEGDQVTPKAELLAATANIYFAVGDLASARTLLEQAAHALQGDFPRSLAGLILARLGQVRDALGERELAVRTYRAVLALSFAPAVARAVAEAGVQTPFTLDLTPGEAPPWRG